MSHVLYLQQFSWTLLSLVLKKEVSIIPGDKPWYDSETRKFSKLRNRINSKAIKSSKSDWTKYKHLRKVYNLKKKRHNLCRERSKTIAYRS